MSVSDIYVIEIRGINGSWLHSTAFADRLSANRAIMRKARRIADKQLTPNGFRVRPLKLDPDRPGRFLLNMADTTPAHRFNWMEFEVKKLKLTGRQNVKEGAE